MRREQCVSCLIKNDRRCVSLPECLALCEFGSDGRVAVFEDLTSVCVTRDASHRYIIPSVCNNPVIL